MESWTYDMIDKLDRLICSVKGETADHEACNRAHGGLSHPDVCEECKRFGREPRKGKLGG